MTNPYWRFGFWSLAVAVALTLLVFALYQNPILAYLLGINAVAVGLFRYDKLIAGSQRTRVPEKILLFLEAIGGTVGAAFAMWGIRPHHKTQSIDFLVWFFLILILQLMAIVLFIRFFPGIVTL